MKRQHPDNPDLFWCKKCGEFTLINKNSRCVVCTSNARAKWRENNPEKRKELKIKWRENNPEKDRKYYKNNSEKRKELNVKWRKNNPEKTINFNIKYYLIKTGIKDPSQELIDLVFELKTAKYILKQIKKRISEHDATIATV